MSHTATITFIGGGNMTASLVSGLCVSGYSPQHIHVSNPSREKLDKIHALNPINIYQDNKAAAENADIIILAVKPWVIAEVCTEISGIVKKNHPLIISIATGVSSEKIAGYFGDNIAIVRAMPNIASQILQGATGLFANPQVTAEQHAAAEKIFQSVGITTWVDDENQLHIITALSGSGVAYHFLFMEAIVNAGVELGLSTEVANALSIQTALGAAKMAAETELTFTELRNKVAVAKGTTAKALEVMENHDIRSIMQKALNAAYQRSIELAQ